MQNTSQKIKGLFSVKKKHCKSFRKKNGLDGENSPLSKQNFKTRKKIKNKLPIFSMETFALVATSAICSIPFSVKSILIFSVFIRRFLKILITNNKKKD